jgi:putative transposase
MRRAYHYRLLPTRQQTLALLQMLDTHRHLYNRALAERKIAWEQEQRSVHYEDQSAQLKLDRAARNALAAPNFSSCQATLRRLKRSFENFFRRVKAGAGPGYPRFKGRDRFDTVEFPKYGAGCKIADNRVYFQHIGNVRILLHRPIQGVIKTLSFTRRADDWYLIVSCDLDTPTPEPHPGPVVGIDLGLLHFAMLSTGEQVANPRFFRRDAVALAQVQRRLSRCPKGSPERERHKRAVRKVYDRIVNRRRDFAHKLSRDLVRRFGTIVFEDLNIVRMVKHPTLAKSIADAAWNQLIAFTTYKAEDAGSRVVQIDPAGTSQRCSTCGAGVPKGLLVRVHTCPHCGLQIDRDLNAARNIRGVGLHTLGLAP